MLPRRTAFGVFMLLAAGTVRAEATLETDASDLLHHAATMNSAAMLEGAGSHGSLGISIGAGATLPPPAPESRLAEQILGSEERAQPLPRLWLMKGLPLPVDVAVTGARDAAAGISQMAGALQWTPFEALGVPAVTVRLSHGRLRGIQEVDVSSSSAEALVGMGFLRLFHVYGGAGISQHKGALALEPANNEAYAMRLLPDTTLGEQTRVEEEWTTTVRRAGLRVTLVPPFVALTAEAEWQERPSYAAKLSIGM